MKYKMGYYVVFNFDGKQRDGAIVKSSDEYAIVLLDGVETSISPDNILMFNEGPTMPDYRPVGRAPEVTSCGFVPDDNLERAVTRLAELGNCQCFSCRQARGELTEEELGRLQYNSPLNGYITDNMDWFTAFEEEREEANLTSAPSRLISRSPGGYRPDTIIIDDLEGIDRGPENA